MRGMKMAACCLGLARLHLPASRRAGRDRQGRRSLNGVLPA